MATDIVRKSVKVEIGETHMVYQYEPFSVKLASELVSDTGVSGADIKQESDRLRSLVSIIIDERMKIESSKNKA